MADGKVKGMDDQNIRAGKAKEGAKEMVAASLRKAFEVFDTDKDGMISDFEFLEALTREVNGIQAYTDDKARKLFKEVDTNGDGQISYEEFVKKWAGPTSAHALKNAQLMLTMEGGEAACDAIFAKFDKDMSGSISTRELTQAIQDFGAKMGIPWKQGDIDKVIKKYDIDDRNEKFGDKGGLSKIEFKQLIADMMAKAGPGGKQSYSLSSEHRSLPMVQKEAELGPLVADKDYGISRDTISQEDIDALASQVAAAKAQRKADADAAARAAAEIAALQMQAKAAGDAAMKAAVDAQLAKAADAVKAKVEKAKADEIAALAAKKKADEDAAAKKKAYDEYLFKKAGEYMASKSTAKADAEAEAAKDSEAKKLEEEAKEARRAAKLAEMAEETAKNAAAVAEAAWKKTQASMAADTAAKDEASDYIGR